MAESSAESEEASPVVEVAEIEKEPEGSFVRGRKKRTKVNERAERLRRAKFSEKLSSYDKVEKSKEIKSFTFKRKI